MTAAGESAGTPSSIFGTSASIAMGYLTSTGDDEDNDDVVRTVSGSHAVPGGDFIDETADVSGLDESGNEDGELYGGMKTDDFYLESDGGATSGVLDNFNDGVAADGVAADGVAVDGVAVDGVAADGVAVDGVAADGVAADGLDWEESDGDEAAENVAVTDDGVVVNLQHELTRMQNTINSLKEQLDTLHCDVQSIMRGGPIAVHGHVALSSKMSYHSEEVAQSHFPRSITVKDLEKKFENEGPVSDTLVSFM